MGFGECLWSSIFLLFYELQILRLQFTYVHDSNVKIWVKTIFDHSSWIFANLGFELIRECLSILCKMRFHFHSWGRYLMFIHPPSLHQGCRIRGAGGTRFLQISNPNLNREGKIMPSTLLCGLPDFQNLRRPCWPGRIRVIDLTFNIQILEFGRKIKNIFWDIAHR